jgi:hypothetical protein
MKTEEIRNYETAASRPFTPGDTVYLKNLNVVGTVVSAEPHRMLVSVGSAVHWYSLDRWGRSPLVVRQM